MLGAGCTVPLGDGPREAPVSGGPSQTSCLESCDRDFRVCGDTTASTRAQPTVLGAASACGDRAAECRRRCGS
jgi:hypothetical protein